VDCSDGERRAAARLERCDLAAGSMRALLRVFAVVRFSGIFTSLPRYRNKDESCAFPGQPGI
jgi:hypothetical protein